ncbi:MAG: response regulator [bacterium]|nr:response regulator [bacterium]
MRDILIVEDNSEYGMNATQAAREAGFNPVVVDTLCKAREYLKDNTPAIILTDMCFPVAGDDSLERGSLKQVVLKNRQLCKKIKEMFLSVLRERSLEQDKIFEEIFEGIEEKSPERRAEDYLLGEFESRFSDGNMLPSGYFIIRESIKRNIPYAVVTDVSGHGSDILYYIAGAGAMSEEEALKVDKARQEDCDAPLVLDNPRIVLSKNKPKEDWLKAIKAAAKK